MPKVQRAQLQLHSEPYIDNGTKMRSVVDFTVFEPFERTRYPLHTDFFECLTKVTREGWTIKQVKDSSIHAMGMLIDKLITAELEREMETSDA